MSVLSDLSGLLNDGWDLFIDRNSDTGIYGIVIEGFGLSFREEDADFGVTLDNLLTAINAIIPPNLQVAAQAVALKMQTDSLGLNASWLGSWKSTHGTSNADFQQIMAVFGTAGMRLAGG